MASIQFTPADRDERGFIKVPPSEEPRSLADLLPTPEAIKQDATRVVRQKLTKQELALIFAAMLLAVFIVVSAWTTPETRTTSPVARPTALPTVQATAALSDGAPAPTPVPAAIVARFDYTDPETATAIEARRIARVVGQATGDWRLVEAGDARVWVEAGQIPAGVPADDPLPDLTPRRPAPLVPAAAPQAAPVAAPAPVRCAEVGIPGKITTVCGTEALELLEQQAQQQWLATYGGNVGTVGAPTAQPMRSIP